MMFGLLNTTFQPHDGDIPANKNLKAPLPELLKCRFKLDHDKLDPRQLIPVLVVAIHPRFRSLTFNFLFPEQDRIN